MKESAFATSFLVVAASCAMGCSVDAPADRMEAPSPGSNGAAPAGGAATGPLGGVGPVGQGGSTSAGVVASSGAGGSAGVATGTTGGAPLGAAGAAGGPVRTGGGPGGGSANGGQPGGGADLPTEQRTVCSDTCWKSDYVKDGKCYDGGPKSTFNSCAFGTDCSDCGPRTYTAPLVGAAGKSACGSKPFTNKEGGPAEDFSTYDQHGKQVRLSDFCGKWVYMELGAMWCGACNAHADDLEAYYQALKDYKEGLVVIDSLGENINPIAPNATATPSVAELAEWATQYGQTLPAICDADYAILGRFYPFGPGLPHPTADSYPMPQGVLIRPDGIIEYLGQMAGIDALRAAMDGETFPR